VIEHSECFRKSPVKYSPLEWITKTRKAAYQAFGRKEADDRLKGEAIIELKSEIDPKKPKDPE
jgi:hypothetical protein